jgi:hypothetical protein
MRQLTSKEAISWGESGIWKEMNYLERALFQLAQDKLCMPFDVFHEALEKATGRAVYTHELGVEGGRDRLSREILGSQEAPTLKEVINLIPEHKRIIVKL